MVGVKTGIFVFGAIALLISFLAAMSESEKK